MKEHVSSAHEPEVSRYLLVDLEAGRTSVEKLDPEVTWSRVGGAAINTELFTRFVEQDPVVLGIGPLSGTFAPAGCLAVLTARSPINGQVYHAPLMRDAGAELRFSGLQSVVLIGSSKAPICLMVTRAGGEIESAEALAGKDVWETFRAIRVAERDWSRCVLAVGKPSEEGIVHSQVCHNLWGTLDKQGFGAVLGAKGVKAISIGGTQAIPSDEAFFQRAGTLRAKLLGGREERKEGTLSILEAVRPNSLHIRVLKRGGLRHHACFACPFPCMTFVPLPRRLKKTPDYWPEGVLLTDPGGLLAFGRMGKDAFVYLAEAFRLGLEPISSALFLGAQKKNIGNLEALRALTQEKADLIRADLPHIHGIPSWPQPIGKEVLLAQSFGVFASGIAPIIQCDVEPGNSIAHSAEWIRKMSLAFILGLCPVMLSMFGEISEEQILALLSSNQRGREEWSQRLESASHWMMQTTRSLGQGELMVHPSLKEDDFDRRLKELVETCL